LIRPLGLVTLYFGYAEFEVNALLDALASVGLAPDTPRNISLGQKLAVVRDLLSGREIDAVDQLISIVDEARPLIEHRNALVHSSIAARGVLTPSGSTRPKTTITPEQLNELADAIFTWKERLNATRQKRPMPALNHLFHRDKQSSR
jgi:hypothetical protein